MTHRAGAYFVQAIRVGAMDGEAGPLRTDSANHVAGIDGQPSIHETLVSWQDGEYVPVCHILNSDWRGRVANWKINCMEGEYPGLWHTWFREQIIAVGWPPDDYGLQTPTKVRAWSDARRYLVQINAGDKVIVQLKNWRVGRIGTVLGKQIEDGEWNPSVPPQGVDLGEMGRRVQVRWDLTTGPLTPTYVVELPLEAHPNMRIWRPTLSQVPDAAFTVMERAVREESNWVSLIPGFASDGHFRSTSAPRRTCWRTTSCRIPLNPRAN